MTPRATRIDGPALPAEAWANGGGATRTFGRENDTDGATLWRISLATLAGPSDFSRFPGLDRTFVLIDRDSVELHTPDGLLPARRGQPVHFSGDMPVRLVMPTGISAHALNVMTRRGHCHAQVEVIADDAQIKPAAMRFLISLAGKWRVTGISHALQDTDGHDGHAHPPGQVELAPWLALRLEGIAHPITLSPIRPATGPEPLLAVIGIHSSCQM